MASSCDCLWLIGLLKKTRAFVSISSVFDGTTPVFDGNHFDQTSLFLSVFRLDRSYSTAMYLIVGKH